MAFDLQSDPFSIKTEKFLLELKQSNQLLKSIQTFIDQTTTTLTDSSGIQKQTNSTNNNNKKSNDGPTMRKIKSDVKQTIDKLTKCIDIIETLKKENEEWRKSIVIEIYNYILPQNKALFSKNPTRAVPLNLIKWPSENSSENKD